MKQPFQIPKRLWATKKIEATKKPKKQILFSISMPKKLFLLICCNVKFWDLADTFLYLKWLFQKTLVYFVFGALLNIPIYVREEDLEP